MVEFTLKCPFIVCTQTAHGNMSRGKNVLRKPVLIGLIEFDIVIVRDMWEKATENKVYLAPRILGHSGTGKQVSVSSVPLLLFNRILMLA